MTLQEIQKEIIKRKEQIKTIKAEIEQLELMEQQVLKHTVFVLPSSHINKTFTYAKYD